jgi:hypothetical protein
MMAIIRHRTNPATPQKHCAEQQHLTPSLIRWYIEEIRRIAVRPAQRRIQPAHVIAWSLWRRAHQATGHQIHIRHKVQL